MDLSSVPNDRAKGEAAGWFARMKRREVTAAELEAFRQWRQTPGNKEAYDEVDAFWRTSGELKTDPDIQAAIDAALFRQERLRRRRTPHSVLSVAIACALAAVLAGSWFYIELGPRRYATGVGEQKTVSLKDGSLVTLDTDSLLSVRMGKTRRRLELRRGQAMFNVAHDATRPFTVTAGKTSVTALGTRFDVRREDGGAAVTLLEGSVEVVGHPDGAPKVWRLRPGQRVNTKVAGIAPAPVDVAVAGSWTSGRLVFRNMALAEAVAEFDRYERRKIELDPGPWTEDQISGVFQVGDTQAFVTSVAQLHNLTVSYPARDIIRLGRSETMAPQ